MRERDFRAERLLGEKDAQSKRRKLSFGEIQHIGRVVKENVLVVSFLENILAIIKKKSWHKKRLPFFSEVAISRKKLHDVRG